VRLQVLSSGSRGNCTLVRAGECTLLVDAGLPPMAMRARLQAAGLAPFAVDHVLVTHAHLDHARSAGVIAKRERAEVHAPERVLPHRALRRAPRLSAVRIGRPFELPAGAGPDRVTAVAAQLPHDAEPTVAYRLEHAGRVAVVLTDMGQPRREPAALLGGAHVLVLEFNHDEGLVAAGPYPEPLKRRILGDRGHLSNAQAAAMLRALAGPELHTLVLAHLSETNNRPLLALEAARATLAELGRADVRVLVASQDEVGESLEV
jgi:phosphoribosyl 1,2-cyclic phosphodiesterase